MLTGFLGSGKTTLLARLLEDAATERTAVLINEVGEVPLDHHLVEGLTRDVSLLPPGCVCCVVGGELDASLETLLDARPERVVLETTGLADPAPVLHALATSARARERVRFGGVVVTLDASRGAEVLDAEPEGRLQLELADRVVLTKLDIAAPEPIAGLRERLAVEHPSVEVIDGAEPRRAFADTPALDAERLERWLAAGSSTGAHGARTRILELPSPVDLRALELWLRMVTQIDGPRLLRIKGIVETSRGFVLLQSAQRALSPARALEAEPSGWRGSRLVVISRGMPERALDALARAAVDAARGTRRS